MPDDELRRKIDAYRRFIRQMEIRVLVWGPGPPSAGSHSPGYNKRLQIKAEILNSFPLSLVYFSEDQEMRDIAQHLTEQLLKEALQAKAVDMIIILDMSRGAEVEIDHFIETYDWFPSKAYVFLPDRYINTANLAGDVLGKLAEGHLVGFTQDEFKRCDVATIMAVKAVEQTITRKYLLDDV